MANYRLAVKYVNRITHGEGAPYILEINMRSPWYISTWGQNALWSCCCLGVAGIFVAVYLRRLRRNRAEEMALLEHQHREEVYEEKLRFFTNINP